MLTEERLIETVRMKEQREGRPTKLGALAYQFRETRADAKAIVSRLFDMGLLCADKDLNEFLLSDRGIAVLGELRKNIKHDTFDKAVERVLAASKSQNTKIR